jgi:glucosamine--fructose-6-phosphate aminotransferase (isomerizing)
MCGIVGYIGEKDAPLICLEGLRRLEYRGYDSAGIAVVAGGVLDVRKVVGKLANLAELLEAEPLHGTVGIGHTRWATHGKPSVENSHPHLSCAGDIAVVHNGIIENYAELRERLQAEGHVFRSQTDTETAAHLIEKYYEGDLGCSP